MVNIDGIDRASRTPLVGVMMWRSLEAAGHCLHGVSTVMRERTVISHADPQ
jgi:hypothetical protein